MSTERKKHHQTNQPLFLKLSPWLPLLRYIVLFAGLFFYYRLFVLPEYIYFHQLPNFFTDSRYIIEHLQLPGGFLEYIAHYLTSLFQFGWLGALILAGLVLVSYMLLHAVLRPRSLWIAPLLPIVLLVMVQANYDYPIVKTLSFILALEGFLLYRDAFPQKNSTLRFGITVVSMAALYYLSPFAMFLFTVLCVLYESLGREQKIVVRISLSLGYAAIAVLLPWLLRQELFLISLRNAYIRHSPLWQGDELAMLSFSNFGNLRYNSVYLSGIIFSIQELQNFLLKFPNLSETRRTILYIVFFYQ